MLSALRPYLHPDRQPVPLPAVPLVTLEPSKTLIVVKEFSPSRGSVRGGTTASRAAFGHSPVALTRGNSLRFT